VTSTIRSRIAKLTRAAAPLATTALAVAALLRYPPEQSTFYPRCPFYELLHLQCPGCGATRALAAILHGNFTAAMHFNALVTLALPFAIAYSLAIYRRFLQHKALHWPTPPPPAIYAAIAVAAIFGVLRNLPLHPF
jgi:hypothetical protein